MKSTSLSKANLKCLCSDRPLDIPTKRNEEFQWKQSYILNDPTLLLHAPPCATKLAFLLRFVCDLVTCYFEIDKVFQSLHGYGFRVLKPLELHWF